MNILLQRNIWDEYGYDTFLESVINNCDSCQIVDVIPFTNAFQQKLEIDPDYVFGSTRFVNICKAINIPTFQSFGPIELDLFDKEYWINGDGYETTWGDLNIVEPVFVKPFTEKFFTGVVVDSNEDKAKVQLSTSFIESENAEKIWVSKINKIEREVRFFVIGGQIVTGSTYKIQGVGNHQRIYNYSDEWNMAKEILKTNMSDTNTFVLDIGLIAGSWKIVELNNLNSSGFYKCDTDVIVRALKYLN